MKFRIGDIVLCIDGYQGYLSYHKMYTITDINEVGLVCIDHDDVPWSDRRFKKIKLSKLLKILLEIK